MPGLGWTMHFFGPTLNVWRFSPGVNLNEKVQRCTGWNSNFKKSRIQFRETGPLQLKIFRHSYVIRGNSHWLRISEWHPNDGNSPEWQGWNQEWPHFSQQSGMTGMTGMRGMCWEWPKPSFQHHSCHFKGMSFHVIPVLEWPWNEWNDTEWRYIFIMN